ncbi:hypothetical protein H5410_046909 [Solanum commersonii]|uniref:Endonuclease/exonuclease/phosphatase domain-containing protein n=1 Tax=Solanum commersonii TaxID=4109 RepID=A0A9J5XDL4_SOLCO|nr:hypothetical protein H5410_046909 [Solanum commersonii]
MEPETMCKKTRLRCSQELKSLVNFDVKFKNSGNRRGILMLWDNRVWKGDIVETERRSVWEEMGAIRGIIEGPWVVCGDFNVVRFILEKRNCVRRTRGMKEFSDVIDDLKLLDLQLEDNNYPWFKGDNLEAASRIDRILILEEWDESFNNIKQNALQRLVSDHSPVALQGGVWNKKKNHFKFENWWLGTEGFTDRISSCEQGNLGSKRRVLLKKLSEFDEIMKGRGLSEWEISSKNSTLLEYEELLKNEEISWRQKSRSLWLK